MDTVPSRRASRHFHKTDYRPRNLDWQVIAMILITRSTSLVVRNSVSMLKCNGSVNAFQLLFGKIFSFS